MGIQTWSSFFIKIKHLVESWPLSFHFKSRTFSHRVSNFNVEIGCEKFKNWRQTWYTSHIYWLIKTCETDMHTVVVTHESRVHDMIEKFSRSPNSYLPLSSAQTNQAESPREHKKSQPSVFSLSPRKTAQTLNPNKKSKSITIKSKL